MPPICPIVATIPRNRTLRGHRREQVDIAFHQRGLGHNDQRMPGFGQDFDDAPREFPFVFGARLRPAVFDRFARMPVVAGLRTNARSAPLDDLNRPFAYRNMVGFRPPSRPPCPLFFDCSR